MPQGRQSGYVQEASGHGENISIPKHVPKAGVYALGENHLAKKKYGIAADA